MGAAFHFNTEAIILKRRKRRAHLPGLAWMYRQWGDIAQLADLYGVAQTGAERCGTGDLNIGSPGQHGDVANPVFGQRPERRF